MLEARLLCQFPQTAPSDREGNRPNPISLLSLPRMASTQSSRCSHSNGLQKRKIRRKSIFPSSILELEMGCIYRTPLFFSGDQVKCGIVGIDGEE